MADYPASLPVLTTPGANLDTDPHSALHDEVNAEVLAIATELGTAPSGTFSTVKTRLENLSDGVWTSYTPSLAGTGWAIGNGTAAGAHCKVGKIVVIRASWLFGSTSTAGGSATCTTTLPIGMTTGVPTGHFYLSGHASLSAGSSLFPVGWRFAGSDTMAGLVMSASGSYAQYVNAASTVPFTWTTGSILSMAGVYQTDA